MMALCGNWQFVNWQCVNWQFGNWPLNAALSTLSNPAPVKKTLH